MDNKAQAEALRRMHGDPLELIPKFGAEFREIIEDFWRDKGRGPTANDLLWIASQHAGKDLTK